MTKAIYIRTSTQEQEPENQIKDCESMSGKDYTLYEEKQSAWNDKKEREVFEKLKKDIQYKRVTELFVWDLDRLFRNRKKLIEFFEFLKVYKCKINSIRQQWLNELNNIPEPFNEIMHSLMLQIMGWIAEEESTKKSHRVKLAIKKVNGVTVSYKDNKWGRKALKLEPKILELHISGKSIRDIVKEVYYIDHNNNKKFVSLGYVHKIIRSSNEKNSKN